MKELKGNNFCRLFICVFVLALFFTTPVFAETITIWDGLNDEIESTETDEDSAEDTVYSLLRGSDLNYGNAKIYKMSSGQVGISGATQCHHKCDTLYLSLYLERKVNGVYSTYKYWNFSTSNATHLAKGISVIVPSGYYYRVSGYHATSNDGREEAVSSLTNGIWID